MELTIIYDKNGNIIAKKYEDENKDIIEQYIATEEFVKRRFHTDFISMDTVNLNE